jgi:hypothetical protein
MRIFFGPFDRIYKKFDCTKFTNRFNFKKAIRSLQPIQQLLFQINLTHSKTFPSHFQIRLFTLFNHSLGNICLSGCISRFHWLLCINWHLRNTAGGQTPSDTRGKGRHETAKLQSFRLFKMDVCELGMCVCGLVLGYLLLLEFVGSLFENWFFWKLDSGRYFRTF